VSARLGRLQEHYEEHGMRRTCEGVLVCHEHNHPHILMLQIANAFFKLPGDYLQAEDDEVEGFKRRLNERLAPVGSQFSGEGVNDEWVIGDTLSQWWRPNFETFMYPFIPAHCTRPKECKKLYFIQLPKSSESSSLVLAVLMIPRGSLRPQEHEAARGAVVRAVRQRAAIRPTVVGHPAPPVAV
jgi:cleavage and polyadenylation specificity factor subunit 5